VDSTESKSREKADTRLKMGGCAVNTTPTLDMPGLAAE
jgi:hypothetical protein